MVVLVVLVVIVVILMAHVVVGVVGLAMPCNASFTELLVLPRKIHLGSLHMVISLAASGLLLF